MFRKSIRIKVITSLMFVTWLIVLLSYSPARANVTRADLLISSTDVANYMEEYRHLPQNVQVGIQNLSTSQFLYLMAVATNDINQNINNEPYPIPVLTDPPNPYPSITFNDEFYSSPLNDASYMDLISTITSNLESNSQAPDYFTYQSNPIRYCAIVHYLSSILRFYDFYGYLPNSMDIKVISPKNLVPIGWETPIGMEHYTSGITYHSNSDDNVYYRHSILDYGTFKLAKQLIEGNALYPDLYSSLETIYDWVRFDTWLQWGYGQTPLSPFVFSGLGLWSAREAWSARLSTSGAHDIKMVALYRSLGIPAYLHYVYFEPEGRWLNTDVHDPFGSAPMVDANGEMYPGFEDSPLPSPTEDFVNEIRSLINYESPWQNQLTDFRGLFINASDISEYGVDRIVSAAKLGGHNTIILTVKTPYGSLYADEDVTFPSEFYDPIVTGYSYDTKWQVKTLQLDPLFTAAQKEGIKVHLGFNVLSDYLTGYKKFRKFPKKLPNWSQWDGTQWNPYAIGMISPCISEYLTLIKDVLDTYLIRYPADGVVIMDLRWSRGRTWEGVPFQGYNPRCDDYKTSQDWYEQILIDYLQELVTKIRSIKPTSHISFLSSSLYYTFSSTTDLHNYLGQNLPLLSQYVDNLILSIGGHYWLTDNKYDLDDIFKYDFEKIYSDLKAETSTPISIAFYLRDEWEYPSEFFYGLY